MSGGLAPSKSTVYVGNLPFSLTNNDLHKVFEKFGRIAKITILKDKVTRTSKGVAFIQFIERDSATECCKSVNDNVLFERTIKCTIAKDNGRASEFIRKKEYPDKSTCYECGEEGHLSYNCPKNILGEREAPLKKEKKTKKQKEAEKERSRDLIKSYYDADDPNVDGKEEEEEEEAGGEDPYESSLSYAIALESKHTPKDEEYNLKRHFDDQACVADDTTEEGDNSGVKRKKIKQSSYFSDEEEEEN